MLGAPRRSAAVPNRAGSHALYSVSTYSFESHKKTTELRLFDLETKQSTLITNDEGVSEPHWLEDEILYLKSGSDGATQLVVADVDYVREPYTAAIIPGPFSDLRLSILEKGKVAIVGASKAARNGSLYNSETVTPPKHTGLIYDGLMVRHWDKYNRAETNALFYGLLELAGPHGSEVKGRYSLSPLHNALQGTELESPLSPFPTSDHYDVSKSGIIFIAKDPKLNSATHTKSNAYLLPISDFKAPAKSSALQKLQVPGFEGAANSPAFCPAGKSAVFFQMKEDGYEADKNRLIYVPDVAKASELGEALASKDGKGLWDRSPSSATWSNDGKTLYLLAEDEGRGILWSIDVKKTPTEVQDLPKKLSDKGSVSSVHPLANSSKGVLLSGSSLIDNSYWSIYEPSKSAQFEVLSSNSQSGSAFGLSASQVSSFWYDSNGHKIHSWLLRPSNFDSSKKYPLAFLIHGGPQGAWGDSWSTRWNPAVFAEQGYIVVTPNPTGSTSYGQELTDNIKQNWGGDPYEDLYNGFKHLKSNNSFGYIDFDRAVALGASYGGYMINWINGHEFGREFKALVNHDGVFSMFNQISSDELYFPFREFGGAFWNSSENRKNWEKWDPLQHVGEWKTPTLVIHSDKDYRLAVTEGIAAFNALQVQGVESRFLTFINENHWVLKEENSLLWHTVVLNWINKHIGLPQYRDEPLPERK